MSSVVSVMSKKRTVRSVPDTAFEEQPALQRFKCPDYYFDRTLQQTLASPCTERCDHAARCFLINDGDGFNLEQLECITYRGKCFPGMGMSQSTKEPIRVAYKCAAASVACLHEVTVRRKDLKDMAAALSAIVNNEELDRQGISPADTTEILKKQLKLCVDGVMDYLGSTDPAVFSKEILPLPAPHNV